MKQSALALAVLAALSLNHSALAQSRMQVYGLIDAGVEYVNHAQEGGGQLLRVVSGGKNTSRWGFRGSEDLGGGLTAIWQLEGGLLMDTGASDGAVFKRQAWVGLDGALGRLVVGRSFTTTYELVIKFDPLGFAPHYSWATGASATGPSKYGMTTQFDNLVKYTGKRGGFTYGATIGLGERAGSLAEGRKLAVGGSWFGADGLGLMASYEQIDGNALAGLPTRDKTRAHHLGLDYRSGKWRYTVGMRGYQLDAARAGADLRADTWWGGITRTIDNVTLTGAVYHVNTQGLPAAEDADPTMVVVRGMLALSKRTDLYLSLAHAGAAHGQLVGLSRDDVGHGSSQSGITAGMQHRF